MQYIEKIGYKTSAGIKAKVESMEYYPFHLHDDAIEIIGVRVDFGNVFLHAEQVAYEPDHKPDDNGADQRLFEIHRLFVRRDEIDPQRVHGYIG